MEWQQPRKQLFQVGNEKELVKLVRTKASHRQSDKPLLLDVEFMGDELIVILKD